MPKITKKELIKFLKKDIHRLNALVKEAKLEAATRPGVTGKWASWLDGKANGFAEVYVLLTGNHNY